MGRAHKARVQPFDRYVGSRVRMQRKTLRLSQEALGTLLGITFQQVQKYEKGMNRIGAGRLQEISRILHVPVAFFFEGAPQVDGVQTPSSLDKAPTPAYVSDFLASTDGLALTRAFTQILDTKVKQRIVALVEQLSSGEDR